MTIAPHNSKQISDLCQTLYHLGEKSKEHIYWNRTGNGTYAPTCGKKVKCFFYKAKEKRLHYAFTQTVNFLNYHKKELENPEYIYKNLTALKHLAKYFSHKPKVDLSKLHSLIESVEKAYDPNRNKKKIAELKQEQTEKNAIVFQKQDEEHKTRSLLEKEKNIVAAMNQTQKTKLDELTKKVFWVRINHSLFFVQNIQRSTPDVTFQFKNRVCRLHSLLLATMVSKAESIYLREKAGTFNYDLTTIQWDFENPEVQLYTNKITHIKEAITIMKIDQMFEIKHRTSDCLRIIQEEIRRVKSYEELFDIYVQIEETWKDAEKLKQLIFECAKKRYDVFIGQPMINSIGLLKYGLEFCEKINDDKAKALAFLIRVATFLEDDIINHQIEYHPKEAIEIFQLIEKLQKKVQDINLDYVVYYSKYSKARKDPKLNAEGLAGLRKIADQHTRAAYHVGLYLLKEPNSQEEACKILVKVATKENKKHMSELIANRLAGLEKQNNTAIKFMMEYVQTNKNHSASIVLGRCFLEGSVVGKDLEKAHQFFVNIAVADSYPEHVEEDIRRFPIEMLNKYANNGSICDQVYILERFISEQNRSLISDQTMEWLLKLTKHRGIHPSIYAKFALVLLNFQGVVVQKNEKEGNKWLAEILEDKTMTIYGGSWHFKTLQHFFKILDSSNFEIDDKNKERIIEIKLKLK